MSQAIGAVLAFAVGVGISPIPIVAIILVLFSQRAKVNGPVFLAGWLLALTAVMTVVLALSSALDVGGGGSTDDGVAWLKVALGVVLLAGGLRRWRGRPGHDDEPELPSWMQSIDELTPTRTLAISLALGAVNPKNLMLAIGAGTSLAAITPSAPEAAVGIATFVLVGSAAILLAVGYATFGGEGAQGTLDEARTWLTANNSAVMAVLFLVFGAVLISNGLSGA